MKTQSIVGTWEYDVLSQHMSVDDSMLALFGLAHGEYDGSVEGFLNLLHDEDKQQVANAVIQTLETGVDYDVTYRVVAPSTGECTMIEAKGQAVYDKFGNLIKVSGTCITAE